MGKLRFCWGAFVLASALSGCTVDPRGDDSGLGEANSPLVSSCTTDAQCGAGYACLSAGTCVRPSNCYSGASGPGVLAGSLVIDATDTQADIDALNGAWCVTGDVSIKKTALVDVAGLASLVAVSGNIQIEDNPLLVSLHGFEAVHRAGKLALFRNASLASIAELSRLNTLMSLQVYINPKLVDLNGLQGVTSISNAEVVNNPGLTSLNGLGSVTSVYSYIDVRFNPLLIDVTGLGAITSVGNLVQVTDNVGLASLQGLGNLSTIGSTLRVWRNAKLTSLNALTKLTRTPTFQVADNPLLDSCTVTDLATHVAADCAGCARNGACAPPDHCPTDAAKLEPGICGCGVADTDTDGDGAADCVDPCPSDSPNDSDQDGVCNSADLCVGSDDHVDADQNGIPDGCQECVTAASCDDSNPCTVDECTATACAHTPLTGASCGDHGTCSAAAECVVPRCRFQPLGFAPFARASFATAVSADGKTVVGASGIRPFRWREDTGLVVVDVEDGRPATVSADGTKIAGDVDGSYSFREAGGSFVYTDLAFIVLGGSADGRTLVGRYGSSTPMRWLEGGQAEIIWPNGAHGWGGGLAFGSGSYAAGASADGSLIVGGGILPDHGGRREAYVWNEHTGARGLGTLPMATVSSSASAISPDGHIVVGTSSGPSGLPYGFRWTEESGMVSLGQGFSPAKVTNSGVVVGRGGDGYAAVIGSSLGDGNLKALLQDCGVDLSNWKPMSANDVSPDGKTIVGYSQNPVFANEAMVVHLP